jgi:hypothetical protein
VIKVVTFAGTLTHAGEHRGAAMALCDVVDQFLNKNGLADACAAEQADLTTLCIRREKVDHLDPGDKNFGFGRLVDEQRCFCVDRSAQLGGNRALLVNRLTNDVQNAAKRCRADGNGDLGTGAAHGLTAGQTIGRVHCDGTHGVFAQMLRNFENEAVAVVVGFECRKDRRQFAGERNVDDGTNHLTDAAGCSTGSAFRRRSGLFRGSLLGGGSLRSGGLCSGFLRGGSHVRLPCLYGCLRALLRPK